MTNKQKIQEVENMLDGKPKLNELESIQLKIAQARHRADGSITLTLTAEEAEALDCTLDVIAPDS